MSHITTQGPRVKVVYDWQTSSGMINRGVMIRGSDGRFTVVDADTIDRLISALKQ